MSNSDEMFHPIRDDKDIIYPYLAIFSGQLVSSPVYPNIKQLAQNN
jgi:hypothetical protein